MTTQPAGQVVPDDAVRLRRTVGDYIVSIYKIAFGRPGDHDVFRNAEVRWTDFILPLVLFVVIQVGYAIGTSAEARHLVSINARATAIVLAIVTFGTAMRFIVAGAVTWGLARLVAAPERVLPGLVGYLWTIAALVAPGIMIVRFGVSAHEPWWALVMHGVAAVAVAIFFPMRIMKVAFALPGMGTAFLLAVAGSIVSFVVDFLLAGLF